MPQFDQFSFFNQVFFFILFFFSFYFIISYFFLPKICYNIKFRKKILITKINKKQLLNLEIKNKQFIYNNLLKNFINYFNTSINENISNYNNITHTYLIKNSLIKLIYIQKLKHIFNKKFILSKKYLLTI